MVLGHDASIWITKSYTVNYVRHRYGYGAPRNAQNMGTLLGMLYRKANNTPFADALYKEAKGLNLLRSALSDTAVRVPEVVDVTDQCLIMTSINSSACSTEQMKTLGEGLAELHLKKQIHYGLSDDNYIGLNPQPNKLIDDWGAFFLEQRLAYQVSLIKDQRLQRSFRHVLEENSEHWCAYLNEHCEHPSLVHGDLWSGNYLCDETDVWLIDPAVYYADREVDLAMSEMFGGFPQTFYEAYDAFYPRTDAYKNKKVIYNLYHYLNHYNLFGASYLPACEQGFQFLQRRV